jgi:CheY-like chemotaxis protein
LTSSVHDEDIHRAYRQGANAYLAKPTKQEDLIGMAKTIKEFWLTHNRTPQKGADTSRPD